MKDFVIKSIASVGGSGYFPIAPGTVASALAWGLMWYIKFSAVELIGLLVVLFPLGIWSSTVAEKYWGKDPSRVTIDEFVGMIISILFVTKSVMNYFMAFIFFRIFDIAKPFPVNRVELWPAGWGIMADDACAGIYANLMTQIFFRVVIGSHV